MAHIGVMTFLHNDNYGSTLQAWALQKTLQSVGHEAEHIDYCPSKMEKIRNLLQSGNSPKLVLEGLKKKSVKVNRPGAREKSASFTAFYQEQMRLSVPCKSHAELKKQADVYDMLLCGSDQIWSPVWLNPAYFLDFAGRKPRIAYAASLGVARLKNRCKARKMASLTKAFSAISVREEEGAKLLEQITGKYPVVMPDPVLLVEQSEWRNLAQPPEKEKPYLLCYFIGDRDDYWTQAESLAAEKGLSIRVLPVTERSYQVGFPLADGVSPRQWLGWIEGAACVCTDSFHGAAFATIFHKPLHMLRRYQEDDPESKNSRIDQLTRSLYGDGQTENADWAQVDARLKQMRMDALDWLKKSIREAL